MLIETNIIADKPKRGRPATGRRVVVQVPLDADIADKIRLYADQNGTTVADVMRGLVDGRIKRRDLD